MRTPRSKETQLEALRLHFEEKLTYTQISQRLSIPKGSLAAWISIENKVRREAAAMQQANDLSASSGFKGDTILQAIGSLQKSVDSKDQSIDSTEPSSRDREDSLKILRRQLKSKMPLPQHKIDAAKAILARLAKPKQVEANPDAWRSQYEGMTDNEIAERIVTIGASMLGIDTLYVVLDRLKASGQADVVSSTVIK